MKKVKVEIIGFKVLEYTKRTKKVKNVEFTYKIDGNYYTSRNQMDLTKRAFSINTPFSNHNYFITSFHKRDLDEQIELMSEIVEYVSREIKVGNAGDMLIDIEIEDRIKRIINDGFRDIWYDDDTCRTSLYGEQRLAVGHVKTPFLETLFDYYKSDGSVSFDILYNTRKYNI